MGQFFGWVIWVDALSSMSKQWVDGSVGRMGQFFGRVIWVDALSSMSKQWVDESWVKWVSFLDGSYGSSVDALSPMSKQWVDGSMGQMGQFFGWVIWVMGRCTFTHDPPAYLPEACS